MCLANRDQQRCEDRKSGSRALHVGWCGGNSMEAQLGNGRNEQKSGHKWLEFQATELRPDPVVLLTF